jgi:hypothetical protein
MGAVQTLLPDPLTATINKPHGEEYSAFITIHCTVDTFTTTILQRTLTHLRTFPCVQDRVDPSYLILIGLHHPITVTHCN